MADDLPEIPGLDPAHVRELVVDSAIPVEHVRLGGFFSSSDPKALAKLTGRPVEAWTPDLLPALVIPYHPPGFPLGSRHSTHRAVKPARPMPPPPGRRKGKGQKYVRPRGDALPYIPAPLVELDRWLFNPDRPLLVCEGEKKGASAAAHGLDVVAISGVDNAGPPQGSAPVKPLWPVLTDAARAGKEIFVVFDSDRAENVGVTRPERKLAAALTYAGARAVYAVELPDGPGGKKLGLDDFLAAHGRAAFDLRLAAARAAGPLVKRDELAPEWAFRLTGFDVEKGFAGGFDKTLPNACLLLEHDPDWRGVLGFDERTGAEVFRAPPPFDDAVGRAAPRAVTDVDATRACVWCAEKYRVDVSDATWAKALDKVAAGNPFDLFREYLDGLAWDGEARLDGWLVEHLGAVDSEYVRAVGAKWLLSAVARAYRPGAKADHVLVLEGRQGIGKSSALAALVPDERFFADSLPDVERDPLRAADYLRGPVLVELAELASVSKGSVEAVKAFVSRQTDRFRPAYGRKVLEVPRRAVFVGTTNEQEYLRDSSGNRRFWPVRCGEGWHEERQVDVEAVAAVRDALWAEAVARFRAGETWHLDAELAAAARAEQDDREVVPMWLEVVAKHVDDLDWTTVRAVVEDVFPNGDAFANGGRVAKALARLGWIRVRAGRGVPGRPRFWIRPDADSEERHRIQERARIPLGRNQGSGVRVDPVDLPDNVRRFPSPDPLDPPDPPSRKDQNGKRGKGGLNERSDHAPSFGSLPGEPGVPGGIRGPVDPPPDDHSDDPNAGGESLDGFDYDGDPWAPRGGDS